MKELVSCGGGIGLAGGEQFLGNLLQGCGNVLHRHIKGGLAHGQVLTQLVHLKAKLLQQCLMIQQDLSGTGVQTAQDGGQEALGHGIIARGLHPVEVHPLMGGVLVDEKHRVPLLHEDVGVEHLTGQTPGGGAVHQGRLRGRIHRSGRGLGCRSGGGLDRCHSLGSGGRFFHSRRNFVDYFLGGRSFGCGCGNRRAGSNGANIGEGVGGLRRGGGPGRSRLRRLIGAVPHPGHRGGWSGCGGGSRPGRGLDALRLSTIGALLVERKGHLSLVGGDGIRGLEGGDYFITKLRLGVGAVRFQGGEDRVVHGGEDLALISKLHFRLGRVDVHVHGVEPGLQMEDTAGEAPHHLLVFIGLLQGGHHQPGLHLPAVDEEELPVAAPAAAGGQGDKAGHRHILPAGLYRPEAQGQLPAQHGVNGALQLAVSGSEHLLLSVPNEFHTHLRVGQGQALDGGKDGGPLCGVFFHKFQPGGGVEEQVPDHHSGAQGAARLLRLAIDAPLQGQGGAKLGVGGAGEHLHPADGGNGGQGLPPEAQGADGLQVVFRAQLAGGVSEEGGLHFSGRDAASVVGDPEKGHASVGNFHGDGAGPGVDGVFHQLLGHAGRPLHHLAGGNEVGHMGI